MRKLLLTAIILIAGKLATAQVTTSSINGTIFSKDGESLPGATVTATHVPSGTVYTTVSKSGGTFVLSGLRSGGPYTVRVDFVGLQSDVTENIFLSLGEAYNINSVLDSDSKELSAIVVTGRRKKAAPDKTGVSTVLNNKVLTTMPTISRSITDFTRLTPQANGNSLGGRDNRLNNITVDGANLNNNFGLNSDPLPGAGNSPVSLDAFEEISVNLSPFDVKQGNFTGGNIAAITKSGTNTFHGTAYGYFRNQKFVGENVKGQKAANPEAKTTIYGLSVGGPVIKNKLFFFVNAEQENKPPAAGIIWSPTGGSGSGNVSDVPASDLQRVSDYVKTFGYDPGVYDNFPAFKNNNRKFLAKIDWNISNKHKLTAKYSDFEGTQDFQPSQSGNIGGTQAGVTYGPKFSQTAMAFSGFNYQQKDIVRSGSLELNSNFNSRLSNQLLATVTQTSSDKIRIGGSFPAIDILKGGQNYISVGNEPFNGNNNSVINDIYTITNNLTYYAGKHMLTAGVSYEYQEVGNMFMRGATGYYLFNSLEDFLTNQAPLKFAQTYSLIPGKDAIYSAELKIGQLAVYLQDEININPRFKLTLGIRVDQPIYPEQPLENPANSALTFQDREGKPIRLNTGQFPKATPLFSPRAGFRWDPEGDKSLIIRGGTGIFTGRIPFVYLTNIPTNSGMYQYSSNVNVSLNNPGQPVDMNDFRFNPDITAYNPFYNKNLTPYYFPTTAGTTASQDFAVTDRNFKFPQIWRTSIGFDKQFGYGVSLSADFMYTKDINATAMYNANQPLPASTVTTGGITRPAFSANSNATRRLNTGITNAIVLDNTNKGQSFVFTTQVAKAFSNGLYGSLAYNYSFSQDVTANPGSQASSVWNANPNLGTLNALDLYNSAFAVPHRVVGNLSYRIEYAKHLATTFSLFYEGSSQGRYSYIYNGDLNWDGYSQDLMYIPRDARDPHEIQFVDKMYGDNLYTASQQAAIFEAYIEQDPYLRKHRGQVAERFGTLIPWYNRFDAKLIQDIFVNIGARRHTLQLTADVYNVGNLLNKNWGIRKLYTVNNPLRVESVVDGVPSFSISPFNNVPVNKTFIDNVSTASTWSMQLGLRYIF
ncbi:MAG: TonB-dependent receptor [Chitinophagaceae bacterium]|nr:TonB-dependent receptor [Chitinophagaceae bacterium]MCW5926424.1 TonB-dependent receptor [Chitinophagaceae bacterium]